MTTSAIDANMLPVGVIVCDALGAVRSANPAAAVLLDRPGGSLVGAGVLELGWQSIDAQGRALEPSTHPLVACARTGGAVRGALTRARGGRVLLVDAVPAPRGGVLAAFVDCTRLVGSRADAAAYPAGRVAQEAHTRRPGTHRLVHVPDVVNDVEPLISRVVGDDVELRTEVAADTGWVDLDRSQLARALMDLATNARDAMPRGGRLVIGAGNRRLAANQPEWPGLPAGDYVVLTVKDTGLGMTGEVAAQAFDPFFTTKGPGRAGLGLSTLHAVVVASGGQVLLATRLDAGTQVTIALPQAPPPAAARTTVLLIEDTEAVRRVVATVLGANGFHVIEARDGVEGVEALEEHGAVIDAVLTDMVMPRLGGAEVVRRVRERHPRLPVIVMSGYSEDVLPIPADERVVVVTKPFGTAELVGRLSELLADDAP